MGVMLRAWAILVVAVKRLISERWLALATALGLVISVALVSSIPMYADAIHYRVLIEKLSGEEYGFRPPFAFMYRYVGDWAGYVTWEEVVPLDAYMSERAAYDLGLPLEAPVMRYLASVSFRLFPQEEGVYRDTDRSLGWVTFGSATDIDSHITIVEGDFPVVADSLHGSVVEVLMSESMALELGMHAGEVPYRRI